MQNQGTDEFQDLVLSYYRSSDATISTQDMLLGTDEVGSLAASSTSGDESISLTASSTSGTYYYGACVASVSDEGDTLNYCSTGVRAIVADEQGQVTIIPDANLRAVIEAALGKAEGATITRGEMETLTTLDISRANIRNLTGLEFATNLTWLELHWGDLISDVSPLAGLTNLTHLHIDRSPITDISALAGLTNLKELSINYSSITDISALAGLTNLTELDLTVNTISDVSPLAGLTNLTELDLQGNNITDISALAGLTNLKRLYLWNNPLNVSSINDYIPALQARGVTVGFDPTPVTIPDDPTPVTIPDAKLREAIAAKLGKASGETITRSEMAVLSFLAPNSGYISDLTGLEFATNLTALWLLGGNTISDVSPLRDLTNLTDLGLSGNTISDVSPLRNLTNLKRLLLSDNTISDASPLRDLTNLTDLRLSDNTISDVSPLRDLTNLTDLGLSGNTISDVSPLRDLTNLTDLRLSDNTISDVSPLRNLTNLTDLWLQGNLLNFSSVNGHILALKNRGVTVYSDPFFRESPFDIELVFLADFTAIQKRVIEYAARRWMSIIREDLPDYTFTQGWSTTCGDHSYRIPAGERIDDLRIYITSFDDDDDDEIGGWASPRVLRETSHLSVVGCMAFNLDHYPSFRHIALHEIGHVLGFGSLWDDLGFLQNPSRNNPNGDTHFNGPLAIAAFNDAGGRNYTGAKVPVSRWGRSADSHWSGIFGGEVLGHSLLSFSDSDRLSAITLQSLADLGYNVDVTQADPYTLHSALVKASAKIAAPSTHAQPEFSCGTGQYQDPIYVVDPQGRIVRTLGD